ncbi:MAG: Fic family protein [Proteobacteria bacterium]|nr:Fic family protein [Pseudomonadota bacterium]
MARKVTSEEMAVIVQVISKHDEGVGISVLETELKLLIKTINRRTLQRRLKKLLNSNRIISEGKGNMLIYRISSDNESLEELTKKNIFKQLDSDPNIPLSIDGKIIQNLARLPLNKRNPVGYHRSFLEEYEPGATFYLSETQRSGCREMGSTPAVDRPAGTYARDIFGRLLIDLSWASSRLEGNTYNRLDTQNLIEFGQTAKGKDIVETQMILNHKAAIEMLIENVDQIGFNKFTFLNLHAVLSENLLGDESISGRLRRRPVEISGSVYHPAAMPQIIEDSFRSILEKAHAVPDPFERAFFVMVHLPYLQPFLDGNKRVSRLGANIPLIQNNLCPLSFIDVPERAYVEGNLGVYELNQIDLLRDIFLWAYERSCQHYLAVTKTMVEPDPLRIQYREVLTKVIQQIVRNNQQPSLSIINRLAKENVQKCDKTSFQKMVLDTLKNLHEGNVARYKLKLSEFQRWKQSGNEK